MTRLQEHSPLPVYRQIEQFLRDQIERGELQIGERLPSEAELCKRWGISRITVRQALVELQRDSLVERVPGKGTFIRNQRPPVKRLTRLSGFGENMRALGLQPGYETLNAQTESVSDEVIARLQDTGSSAFVVERTLMAGSEPVGFHRSYLPLWLVGHMPEGSLTKQALGSGSLYQAIEKAGVEINRADEAVEPKIVEKEEASSLGLEEGSLALQVKRTVFDTNQRPVEYVILVYRPDRYSYRVQLHR